MLEKYTNKKVNKLYSGTIMIEYPRICGACERRYGSKQSFYTHKKKCAEYAAIMIVEKQKKEEFVSSFREEEDDLKDAREIVNTINNNTVNNTVNNSVVINVQGSFNGLSETLTPILKRSSLSAKDIKCVEQVLMMLRNEGVTTPQALKSLIGKKSVTIQQLAVDIKNSPDKYCHAAMEFGAAEVNSIKKRTAKQSKQETNRLIDLHLRHSVVHLFQNLVLKNRNDDDLHITSDSLASNPLYLSVEGLSVWSQNSGIKLGSTTATKFGVPDKKQPCGWLLVQEDRFWQTLIMDVIISRLEDFLIEEYTGPMKEVKKKAEIEDPAKYLLMKSMDSEDEEDYCIGGYKYEGKYSDLMNRIRGFKNEGTGKEAFIRATSADLGKYLADASKQASARGWYHITKNASSQRVEEQQLVEGIQQLRIA